MGDAETDGSAALSYTNSEPSLEALLLDELDKGFVRMSKHVDKA